MDAAGDDDHCPARPDQLPDRGLALLREQARAAKFALNLPELVEPLHIFGRRDRGDDKWPPQRRLAESLELDAVARLREFAEISGELIPFRQLAIFTDLETERGFRSADLVGLGLRAGPDRLSRN